MGPGRSNWRRWVLGGIAVVLVGVVGGPFVYIHFFEGKAPAPLSLKTAGSPSPAASGATRGNATAGNSSADLTAGSSDQSRRDNQFQHRIMDTSSYPTAQFVLTQPIQLGPAPADGATVTRQVTGNLKLHGTTRSVTFPVSIKQTGSTIDATGSVPIVFADSSIPT